MTYSGFFLNIIKFLNNKQEFKKQQTVVCTDHLILQSVVCVCFQSLSRVTSKSAVKCPFWERWKQRLQKQVNLVKDAIKRKKQIGIQILGLFVVALQDPVETISWLRDRRQENSNMCYCWSFHEVSLSFSSADLWSPKSHIQTSKMSEPRIARWQVTVCCHCILKSHKYFMHCAHWHWDCGWHYFHFFFFLKRTFQKKVRWDDMTGFCVKIEK